MRRGDYDQLNKYSTSFQLHIGNTTKPDNVGVLKNLAIVQAQCVTRGLASDEDALYLVEITDGRGIAHNQWFQAPLVDWYNIRAPAYPDTFHTDSMNGGTTWTWSTMLQNMWAQMSSLGAWPGLPSAPAGTPEGLWFPGVPAWQALCNMLDHLGMAVVADLQLDNPYTIVHQGATDATFATLQARYVTNLEDDLEWIDIGAGRVPGTVMVLFRRRNEIYGTEETVRRDSSQWSTTPLYPVSVSAPAEFSGATGIHYLWSDFTVRYDMNNLPLAADVTTAAAIASERATQYYNRIDPDAHMSQTYAGALPFTTGSLVDGVCWYQDYRRNDRAGWRTHIVYGPDPPWPGIYR